MVACTVTQVHHSLLFKAWSQLTLSTLIESCSTVLWAELVLKSEFMLLFVVKFTNESLAEFIDSGSSGLTGMNSVCRAQAFFRTLNCV